MKNMWVCKVPALSLAIGQTLSRTAFWVPPDDDNMSPFILRLS